ncbi:MAG: hypothetical protein IJ760_08610 [Bacteroidales bacterium]|nr:hypothetical protein [Bacteroidales bacterium]
MSYALYIHGMGSGAKSGTRSSLGHYLQGYEWLCPELPTDPQQALLILRDYVSVFQPDLVVGTSLGGLYTVYLEAPTKVAVNPTWNIDTTLRRMGYGKHVYHCEREDGATHFTVDEPLVQAYRAFRDGTAPVPSGNQLALFSTDDEIVGRLASKQNAAQMQALGYRVEWSSRFGHRLNQAAAKQLASMLLSMQTHY